MSCRCRETSVISTDVPAGSFPIGYHVESLPYDARDRPRGGASVQLATVMLVFGPFPWVCRGPITSSAPHLACRRNAGHHRDHRAVGRCVA